MVSPQKSRAQVEREAAEGKDLYRKSHNNHDVGGWTDTDNRTVYPHCIPIPTPFSHLLICFPSHSLCPFSPMPGEMMDRDYDWTTFTKASLYGVPTPHDNSGTGVRNALHWLHIARRYFQPFLTHCIISHTC